MIREETAELRQLIEDLEYQVNQKEMQLMATRTNILATQKKQEQRVTEIE